MARPDRDAEGRTVDVDVVVARVGDERGISDFASMLPKGRRDEKHRRGGTRDDASLVLLFDEVYEASVKAGRRKRKRTGVALSTTADEGVGTEDC